MIPLMKSAFHNEDKVRMKMAQFLLEGRQLSMGPECAAFEQEFSAWQGRKYSIFVSSGSAANLILIQSMLNMGLLHRGDRVGFSALTWATNVMPLMQLGLVPIPIDIEIETLNMNHDCSIAMSCAYGSMAGIFITNALGLCGDMERFEDYNRGSNTIILEDNCESLGSEVGGRKLGNFGLASTFSFYIGHHLSTIEGGMVCTDNKELAHELIRCRAHGWDRQLPQENRRDTFYSPYTFYDLAYNVRPTELQAVAGREGLKYLDKTIDTREMNFTEWNSRLGKNTYKIDTSNISKISSFAMPLIFKDKISMAKAVAAFWKAEIEIRPIIAGDITQQPFYKKHGAYLGPCKNASYVGENGFYFGNCPEYTSEEIDKIIMVLMEVA